MFKVHGSIGLVMDEEGGPFGEVESRCEQAYRPAANGLTAIHFPQRHLICIMQGFCRSVTSPVHHFQP